MKSTFRKILYKVLTLLFDREKLLFLLANNTERTLLGFNTGGYLYQIGWTNSIIKNEIADADGQPLPWVTYPFIAFIEQKLRPDFELFEYGSGNSTFYFSKRVAHVTSVENDAEWFRKISGLMPPNVQLNFIELEPAGKYGKFITSTTRNYDLIIVDGRERVNCCKESVKALKPGGVIILDDSERTEYTGAIDFLTENGFKRLDFWGLAPAVTYKKCTTVFYRDGNCLQI